MKYLTDADIEGKRVLLRVDFNVSIDENGNITDDERIKQALPTIKSLLEKHNKLILVSHLGRPKSRDEKFSFKPICERLKTYLPNYEIVLIDDFLTEKETLAKQTDQQILVLENIRFYPQEKANDPQFAKELSSLADVYVNDAFGVSHRKDISIVGIPPLLPSFAGMLLEREATMIGKAIENPTHPLVAIIGGAKISTKLHLIDKLAVLADHVLLGGGLANTLLKAQGNEIGSSLCENEVLDEAQSLLNKHGNLVLPTDVIVTNQETNETSTKQVTDLLPTDSIFDIGPASQERFASLIKQAKTIIWNGPVGYFEKKEYSRGTKAIYDAIISNADATSIVGGGDTLTAINGKGGRDKITHISTGGGAMLEFIERGTLPGIEALG